MFRITVILSSILTNLMYSNVNHIQVLVNLDVKQKSCQRSKYALEKSLKLEDV